MSDLIDTTEMYLKAIFEMTEAGVTPIRAKLAARLGQAMPSVSQTVERMVREKLILLQEDRSISFTEYGEQLATTVMRKHRISEAFLFQVLGFPWAQCHEEACRWEHVVSDFAETKMLGQLAQVGYDPYGNPIPGLDELGVVAPTPAPKANRLGLLEEEGVYRGRLERIGEPIQANLAELEQLQGLGLIPGVEIEVVRNAAGLTLRALVAEESLQVTSSVGEYLMVYLERMA